MTIETNDHTRKMRRVTRDRVYTQHSRLNEPSLTVAPGEVFIAETELCSGPWLSSIRDTYTTPNPQGPNPTVVVAVAGAEPGDLLCVQILDIAVDSVGYTGSIRGSNALPREILGREWGTVPTARTVAIQDGLILWNDAIKIPIKPMIGTLGTAPAQEALLNSKGGMHGGNMDVSEVTTGSTIYLPVMVPGALLHIGDVHAIQGDGEINQGGGIECRSDVTLRIELAKKPASMTWVRAEDEDTIMGIACDRSLEESFYEAAREVLCWMVEAYHFTPEDAYLLMGQVMEARCTQFVNPTRSYICKMPKKYLKA